MTMVKITTAILFYLFYWLCCFLGTGTDKKNLAWLRSYPDAVQKAVREHPVWGKTAAPHGDPAEQSGVLYGGFCCAGAGAERTA